jgi:hypothetical protein
MHGAHEHIAGATQPLSRRGGEVIGLYLRLEQNGDYNHLTCLPGCLASEEENRHATHIKEVWGAFFGKAPHITEILY